MEKIPTAEEFLIINDDKDFRLSMSGTYVSEMMIEFAKLHVEAALKEASEKFDHYSNKNAILGSYSLDNIK